MPSQGGPSSATYAMNSRRVLVSGDQDPVAFGLLLGLDVDADDGAGQVRLQRGLDVGDLPKG
jgi:hypothetical protein